MFRTIEYKLVFHLCILIISVGVTVYLATTGQFVYAIWGVLSAMLSVNAMRKHYNKFNQNILFLLNALDNGDYSFHFTEHAVSRRERELNNMMNRIKDILTRARKEVVENERFLSLIVESVSIGIVILNENNSVRATNRAVNQLLGIPVFTHLNQLVTLDESFPELFRDLNPGDVNQIKVTNEREEILISLSASSIILKSGKMKVITLSNIGNELEAKEMESWTRLIRVMTHEIMNSIAPITSLTETLLFSYKMSDGTETAEIRENTIEALETISTTAKGLINFVESYRQFTGVPQPNLSPFALQPMLESILKLESSVIEGKGIKSMLVCQENIQLCADEKQITQILINLIKNAIEAIDAHTGGVIRVQAVEEDRKIYLRVSNNGEPIPEEVLPSIFIPFFTTKDSGTGIGLSVSRYIMRLHGGNLKYHVDGEWTVFALVFPS